MHKLYQVRIESNGLFCESDVKEVNKQLKKADYAELAVVAGTDEALLLSVNTETSLETTNDE